VVEFLAAALDAEQTADRNMLVGAIEERLDVPTGRLAELAELPEDTLSLLLSGITSKCKHGELGGGGGMGASMDQVEASAKAFASSLRARGEGIRDYFPKTAARVAAASQRLRYHTKAD